MSFTFLEIPHEISTPIKSHTGSKEGGLADDALRAKAEVTFQSSGSLDEETMLAEMMKNVKDPNAANTNAFAQMAKNLSKSRGGACEIITLQLPTVENGFNSVSLYCDSDSSFRKDGKDDNSRVNQRATSIAHAAGNKGVTINGTCFIGRALDDESKEWERLDFTEADLNSDAPWVINAAKQNAGRDMSKLTSSGALQNALEQQQGNASGAGKTASSNPMEMDQLKSVFGQNNRVQELPDEVSADKYIWKEDSGDDIEIRMVIPESVTAKNIKIDIKNNSITLAPKDSNNVDLKGVLEENVNAAFLNGNKLFKEIDVEDSSWSIGQEKEGRALVLTLAKKSGSVWNQLFE
jgi:hypothetical protein